MSRWLLMSVVSLSLVMTIPARGADEPAKAEEFSTADQAFRVGAAMLSAREYARARGPLEAALKLAPDDAYRIKVYRALVPVYTQIPEWLPKVEALEFLIAHSDRDAERSLARTELMSFTHQRGQVDAAVKRYEERLKQTPDDEAALFIAIEVYSRLRKDAPKAAELLERYAALQKSSGRELRVSEAAQLAGEYVKAKKFRDGAELYEQTATRDEDLAAWHYKEAASAWLKAGEKTRALAAARLADAAKPEKRGELLEHFFHRNLADVYFETGEFAQAIPHYEQAIAKTKIDGYLKDCEKRLAEAKTKAGK
jgi:tetratricopeptide (TPR) repeat protein